MQVVKSRNDCFEKLFIFNLQNIDYKIYKIYKILKIICNIQINVIQIAQVLNGYLLRTFDKIVSHEC